MTRSPAPVKKRVPVSRRDRSSSVESRKRTRRNSSSDDDDGGVQLRSSDKKDGARSGAAGKRAKAVDFL